VKEEDEASTAPSRLLSSHLERLLRIFTLLAKCSEAPADRRRYLHTAHHFAMRLLTMGLKSAAERKKGIRGSTNLPLALPGVLWGWAAFRPDAALAERLAGDASLTGLTSRAVPAAAATVAYLDELIRIVEAEARLRAPARPLAYACFCLRSCFAALRLLARSLAIDRRVRSTAA